MSYDRADWHYGGEGFPEGAPPEQGGTHIGMFLAWCIMNGLEGDLHKEESKESLEAVKSRKMSGTQFLFKECDEKFWEEDLNEEGNRFAKDYYAAHIYFSDYDKALGSQVDNMYDVQDSWENYDRVAALLDKRFKKWKKPKRKFRFF